MSTFTSTFLLLLVSALCIASTSGSESLGHLPPNPKTAFHEESHQISKRQIEVNQFRVCQSIIAQESCTNGLSQEVANSALECNMPQLARLTSEGCRRNSAGDYCSPAVSYSVNDLPNIIAECSSALTSVCSTRCKNLLTLIRSELGCCANLVFNNTASPFFNPAPFFNALWTRCGVEPITEQCTSSNIDLTPLEIDQTCSTSSFNERAASNRCTDRFLKPIVDELMETGTCQVYAQGTLEQCGVDESGSPCYDQLDELTSVFAASLIACQNLTACNPVCRTALQNFVDAGSCCINNIYNNSLAGITSVRYTWMSSQFWADCGIEAPGLCETKINGAVAPESMLALVATTAAAMTMHLMKLL